MASSRFQQLDNNGLKRTNALGYILEDISVSFLEAQEVRSAAECACLTTIESCLALPCALDADCAGKTLPLVDKKTQAPFVLKAGTICTEVCVARPNGRCLPECASFCLGTIQAPDCASDCDAQRWVTESAPITGAQLNKHRIVMANLCAVRDISCPLYVCKADNCGSCTVNYAQSSTTCDGSDAPATVGTSACSGCNEGDEGCTLKNGDRCVYTGSGGIFAGELANSWVGITLTNGSIAADDLVFQITTKEMACDEGCGDDEAEVCSVPKWVHGGF